MSERSRTATVAATRIRANKAATPARRSNPSSSQRVVDQGSSRLATAIRQAYAGRLTQMQLAAELGVAQNTISRWSTGDVEPRLDDIARLEKACSLPRGYILRSAGYIEEFVGPEDVIAGDSRLDQPRRDLLLAAYRAALSQSKRRH